MTQRQSYVNNFALYSAFVDLFLLLDSNSYFLLPTLTQ